MARKRQDTNAEFVLVHVLYEDGSQRSNRRVPRTQLTGFDDDTDIKQAIEEQDRQIAVMSGQSPGRIKTITRVGK